MLQGSSIVSWAFFKCFNEVSRMFQKSFKEGFLLLLYGNRRSFPSRRRACLFDMKHKCPIELGFCQSWFSLCYRLPVGLLPALQNAEAPASIAQVQPRKHGTSTLPRGRSHNEDSLHYEVHSAKLQALRVTIFI